MASFFVIRGKDNGQHFAVRGNNATIGRDASNQIQLRDTEVSRQHARIIRTSATQFEIIDNKSSNGTYVNSRRIKSQGLRSGDRVQVGRTLMIFTGGPDPHNVPASESVEIITDDHSSRAQIRSSIVSHGSPEAIQQAAQSDPTNSGLLRTSEASDWEIVYQVSQAINRTTDLNELLGQVLDLIFQWIECDRSCILMIDDITGHLTPIHSRDRKHLLNPTQTAKPITISRTILDHVMTTKEGVLTSDAQDDSRWQDAESVASLGVKEAICVPMLGRYGMVGAIYVDTSTSAGRFAERKGKSSFDEEHLKLMIAIAGQAALAIEDTQFYRAMVQSERLAVMGQTIANLSHYVKNILQGVSGGSFLVDDGLKKQDFEVIRKGWGIVEKNQSRISNLVMDMLSFSKDREPELVLGDVRAIVDEVVDLQFARAQEAEIDLQWNRPTKIVEAEFDNEAMHRALLNVVTNAIDATSDNRSDDKPTSRQGTVKIRIATEGPMVSITVADNGVGISEEARPKVFAPFESSKGAKGTGLGLPVTQKILREHGGDITFQSTVGQGTSFVLKWPIRPAKNGPATILG